MAAGIAPPSGYLHDVHEYDLTDRQWKPLETRGTSDFRACHTAVMYNGRMVVFGGWYCLPWPSLTCINPVHGDT